VQHVTAAAGQRRWLLCVQRRCSALQQTCWVRLACALQCHRLTKSSSADAGLNSTAFGVQPLARAGALAAYLPAFGTTLLFGGSAAGSGQLLNDVWEYNSGLNRWARLSDGSGDAAPAARVGHAGAAVLGGSMLVLGGQGSNGVLGDAWVFQTAMQKWVQLTTSSPVLPVARTGHSAVVVNASTVLGAHILTSFNSF
jgi:N-acetylneuraminic acid mutarotase